MEWYYGSEVDDLVVPKDHDSLDSFLLPDNWFPLGITAPQKFASPKKYIVNGTNSNDDELNFNDVDMDICGQDGSNSTDSSILMDGSPQQTLANERPDFQLNDFAGIDQMDDIFMNSLFEEDGIEMENLNRSFSYSTESKYDIMEADDLSTDVNLGSQRRSGHFVGMGSSKYLKTHDFSPSVDWKEREVDAPSRDFCNRRQENILPVKNGWNGHVGVEASLEECVLQELETVMTQLTETTRLCFRDALYRLAENSKQYAVNGRENGDVLEKASSLTVHDETSRFGKSKGAELETNTIDRAIANLMFNKMESSSQNIPAPMNFKREEVGTQSSFDYSKDDSDISHCPHLTSDADADADAEVPIFDRDSHLQIDFSSGVLNMV